jgi:hypothetical protein
MLIFRFADTANAADTACRATFSGSDVACSTRIDLGSSLALPAQSLELGVLKHAPLRGKRAHASHHMPCREYERRLVVARHLVDIPTRAVLIEKAAPEDRPSERPASSHTIRSTANVEARSCYWAPHCPLG